MFQKIDEPNLDLKNPWNGDLFSRSEIANNFCKLLRGTTQSTVIGVNAPYGYGKTFFLRRLCEQIKNEGGWAVYVSAWEYDYLETPTLALLDSLKVAFGELKNEKNRKAALIDLAKAAAPTLAKVATKRIIGLAVGESGAEDIAEAVENTAKDATKKLLDRFLNDDPTQLTLQELKNKIGELVEKNIDDKSNYKTLIIVVDELDRARPSYSITFMEMIKHLFGISRVIFIVGCDREVFSISARHEFGESLPVDGYIRRFFDFWLDLPAPNNNKYIVQCMSSLGLRSNEFLDESTSIFSGISSYLDFFRYGSLDKSFSLREIEQNVCNLNVVLRTLPSEHAKQVALIGFLQGLAGTNNNSYRKYISHPDPHVRVAELRKIADHFKFEHITLLYFMVAWTLTNIRFQPIDTKPLIEVLGNRGSAEDLKQFLGDPIFRWIGERSPAQVFDELLTTAGSLYKPR